MSLLHNIVKQAAIASIACSGAAVAIAQTDLGQLTNLYYRGTQLQGDQIGSGLMAIPAFLTGTDINIAYTKRLDSHGNVMATEIPFVDTFSITHFLGGYKPTWLKNDGLWNPGLGNASMDYAYVDYLGGTVYQKSQISQRLDPYINAGYVMEDITIGIDNVLWNFALNGSHLNGGYDGVYGQNYPAADSTYATWGAIVGHFCSDLASLYPGTAPNFKIGNEYDSTASFNSNYANYWSLYSSSYAAINSYFPAASTSTQIVPGEFIYTSTGSLVAGQVYDTETLLTDATNAKMMPKYVPRVSNGAQNQNITSASSPLAIVGIAQRSYAEFTQTPAPIPTITQCGLNGQPFSSNGVFGSDQGARQAAWEFQILMGLRLSLNPMPARVFHGTTFVNVVNAGTTYSFINGNGMVDLYLDYNYNDGYTHLYWMPVTVGGSGLNGAEVMAVCFLNDATGQTRLMLSTWRESSDQTPVDMTITLTDGSGGTPNLLAAHTNGSWSGIYYGTINNVFTKIQSDLEAAGNCYYTTSSVWNQICVSDPLSMAINTSTCATMVANNYTSGSNYVNIMKNALEIHPTSWLPAGIWNSAADNQVHVLMPPNAILYLQ